MPIDTAPLSLALERLVSADAGIAFAVPGAVLAVCGRQGPPAVVALGVDARGVPVETDGLFPVGSTTKLASGLLLLQLIESGKLSLDAPLGDYLPEARAAKTPGVTIERLMSHTSGLNLEISHDLSDPPGLFRYADGARWPGALAQACLAAEPAVTPGTEVRYSNLAYGLLTLVAERLCDAPFAELLDRRVFAPLGVDAYYGRAPSRPVIAVRDIDSPYAGTELEPINSPMWQSMSMPWGAVLTDARGLLALVSAYRDDSAVLATATARMARSDHAGGLPGGFTTTEPFIGHGPSRSIAWKRCAWGLAVEVQGGKRPHWGPAKLPNSFGQVGSTGALAWCDPDSGTAWVLLGARTTDSGWLLWHGPKIAQAALAATASG